MNFSLTETLYKETKHIPNASFPQICICADGQTQFTKITPTEIYMKLISWLK